MKFKAVDSAVLNLRLWNPETMKKPNQYRFAQCKKYRDSQFEFVALMASLMSVVALAIDALLPALDIGVTIGTTEVDNHYHDDFSSLAQFFGPLQSFGRKPVVYMGFALFIAASFM
jgi:DHA1 family bicyclomycin/chloramphenicol resistance-like MFS transporter